MEKEELFVLLNTDFVEELILLYEEGKFQDWSEVEELLGEYSVENDVEKEHLDFLLTQQLVKHHIFER